MHTLCVLTVRLNEIQVKVYNCFAPSIYVPYGILTLVPGCNWDIAYVALYYVLGAPAV